MGRTRILTVLMVSSALVLVAANANAQAATPTATPTPIAFNRPDLLDVNDSAKRTSRNDYSWARAYADDDGNKAYGSMSGSVQDASHRVRVQAHLYQPDTLKRNYRRAKMSQKRYTWVGVGLYTQPNDSLVAFHSALECFDYVNPLKPCLLPPPAVEDCRGTITADDRAADARGRDGIFVLDPAGDDTIKGRFKCPRGILSDLGFEASDIEIIQGLVGKRLQLEIHLP